MLRFAWHDRLKSVKLKNLSLGDMHVLKGKLVAGVGIHPRPDLTGTVSAAIDC